MNNPIYLKRLGFFRDYNPKYVLGASISWSTYFFVHADSSFASWLSRQRDLPRSAFGNRRHNKRCCNKIIHPHTFAPNTINYRAFSSQEWTIVYFCFLCRSMMTQVRWLRLGAIPIVWAFQGVVDAWCRLTSLSTIAVTNAFSTRQVSPWKASISVSYAFGPLEGIINRFHDEAKTTKDVNASSRLDVVV